MLDEIQRMGMKMEVIEKKLFSSNSAYVGKKRGPPTIPVSPIMLMKTNGVKMSVSSFAIMLMKTQLHRGLYLYVDDTNGLDLRRGLTMVRCLGSGVIS